MDTSNLTLAPPAAFKTQPDAGARVSVTGAGQAAPAETAETVRGSSAASPATTPAEQSALSRPAEAADEKQQSENQVQDILRKLNDLTQTSIAFSQHQETGRTVITVSDRESGEEIRTIPSEDFLAIAAHLQEVLDSADGLKPGLLVSSQA
ncbi:MAG: flagellar protein FlaG [Candidatus Reddybacter sp.]